MLCVTSHDIMLAVISQFMSIARGCWCRANLGMTSYHQACKAIHCTPAVLRAGNTFVRSCLAHALRDHQLRPQRRGALRIQRRCERHLARLPHAVAAQLEELVRALQEKVNWHVRVRPRDRVGQDLPERWSGDACTFRKCRCGDRPRLRRPHVTSAVRRGFGKRIRARAHLSGGSLLTRPCLGMATSVNGEKLPLCRSAHSPTSWSSAAPSTSRMLGTARWFSAGAVTPSASTAAANAPAGSAMGRAVVFSPYVNSTLLGRHMSGAGGSGSRGGWGAVY